jgi:hypothetical protein
MRLPRVRFTVEWVTVSRLSLRSFTIERLMLAVVVLALMSKCGVWLYREWPRPYMQYIRVRAEPDVVTGKDKWEWHWFDMRRPEERVRFKRLKAELEASRRSHGGGKG